MKLLIIDNYDSFTYNLYQFSGEIFLENKISGDIDVIRNNDITLKEINEKKYDKIIISPGPGSPDDPAYFGVCADVLLNSDLPIFGVCLGMQGMAHYFGGKVIKAPLPFHGKTSQIIHDNKGVFVDLPQCIDVMRYHSLIADPHCIPDCLEISAIVYHPVLEAKTDIRDIPYKEKHIDSVNSNMLRHVPKDIFPEIMGLRHKSKKIEGIQFHPESFATEGGKQMIANFII